MSLNAIFDPMVRSYFDDGNSGGGLPVVELTTVVTTSETSLTAEESAMMDALGGMPAIIKVPTADGTYNCVANVFTIPEASVLAYECMFADTVIMIQSMGDGWTVIMATV